MHLSCRCLHRCIFKSSLIIIFLCHPRFNYHFLNILFYSVWSYFILYIGLTYKWDHDLNVTFYIIKAYVFMFNSQLDTSPNEIKKDSLSSEERYWEIGCIKERIICIKINSALPSWKYPWCEADCEVQLARGLMAKANKSGLRLSPV